MFLLNVVADGDFNIIRAFAGDYVKVHAAACKLVDDIDGVYVPRWRSRRRGRLSQGHQSLLDPTACTLLSVLEGCGRRYACCPNAASRSATQTVRTRPALRQHTRPGTRPAGELFDRRVCRFTLPRERRVVPLHYGDGDPAGEVRQDEDSRGQDARRGTRARKGAERRLA